MIPLEMFDSLKNAFPPQHRDVPDPGPDGQRQMGFFTDTSVCIGCKACEVACKQWNQLPSDGFNFTGNSYDNTEHSPRRLGGTSPSKRRSARRKAAG